MSNVDPGAIASSLFQLSGNLEPVDVKLPGVSRSDVASLRGREALSTLFEYEIVTRLDAEEATTTDPSALVSQVGSIVIRDPQGGERTVQGLISTAELDPHDTESARLTVLIRPFFFKLSLGQDCRSFQDMDVVAIAKQVLADAGMPARFELSESYAARDYTAQYQESDFAFLSRLFEEEGIYYWFDHADGSKLVVADKSSSAPELDTESWGGALALGHEMRFIPPAGMEQPRDSVYELGDTPHATSTKFTFGSFDFTKPAFKVGGGHGDGSFEYYDAPGASHEDPGILATRARKRTEGVRARAAMVNGKTLSVRFTPGRSFDLTGHPFSRYDGRQTIVALHVSITEMRNRLGQGNQKPVDVRFVALPATETFRPALVTPHPRHVGLQSGMVIGAPGDEVHPDESGRIRVQHHWDRFGARDDKAGRWVRVAQRGTANSMLLPRVGWNVFSIAEEGSADVPIVLNRTFDAEHPPPYALPENKTRVAYKTATTPGGGTHNELRFEDKKGQEEFFLNSTKDMHVLVKDRKTEFIHANMTRKVGVDHTLTVGGTYDVHVTGTQSVTVGANQTINVTADRTKVVEGNETITIGATRKLTTGLNLETSGESRSMKVGAAQIDITLGAVEATSKMVNTLVGGAVVKVTPRKMSESVGSTVTAETVIGFLPAGAQKGVAALKAVPGVSGLMDKIPSKAAGASFQTVGLTKVELGSTRKIDIAKNYTEKVGVAMNLMTKVLSDTASNAFDLMTNLMHVKTKSLTIKSDKKVTIKAGAATLTVSAADGIKLDAPEIQVSTPQVTVKAKVEQN